MAERPPPRLAAGHLQVAAVAAVHAVLVPRTAGAELFAHGPLLLDVHEPAREASLPGASHVRHAPRLRHEQVRYSCMTVLYDKQSGVLLSMFILHSVYQVSSISQYTTPKHEWYTSKHWFSGPLRKFMYFGFMKNVGQNCQKVASNGAVPSSRERRSSRLHLPPSLSTQCLSHGALPYSDVLIRLRITNPSSLPSLIFFFTCLPCHSKTLETHRHCLRSLLLLTLATGGDVNSSYTLGHSMSCFLVMVWSRKFAGTKVRGVRRIRSQGDGNGAI